MHQQQLYNLCEDIASYLWKRKNSLSNGLYDGKAGVALFFYELFRFSGNGKYEEMADLVISEIAQNINLQEGRSFSGGILGLGWLLETLRKNDFIELDEDVFKQVDLAAIFHSSEGYGLENGFLGIAAYLLKRISGKSIYEKEFHIHFERIIEVNELLGKSLKNKIIVNDLYAYSEFPLLFSGSKATFDHEFLNFLSGLILHYDRLIDLKIQPETSYLLLAEIVQAGSFVLKFLLSDEFIEGQLNSEGDKHIIILSIFELYAALDTARKHYPDNASDDDPRTLYDNKISGLLSQIRVCDINDLSMPYFLKHLIILKKRSLQPHGSLNNSTHFLTNHYHLINDEFISLCHKDLYTENPSDKKLKPGLSGLSGIGMHLIENMGETVDLSYYNSFGI